MMVNCNRCGIAYSHTRSTSALILTYCCLLCEVADLGYSLAAFEKAPIPALRRAAPPTVVTPAFSALKDRVAA
jgi:hypothetical protein